MPIYRHTQRATLILAVFAAIIAVEIALALAIGDPAAWAGLSAAAAIVVVVGVLFSSLTVEVTEDRLAWHFGPGFFKRHIARANITGAAATRTHWSSGWGIRHTKRGWLFNVSGLDAVAVARRDGKTTLIGTDEPRRLVAALGF